MRVSHAAIAYKGEAKRRTVIVVGSGRGGTTMVSGVLNLMGININASFDNLNQEDTEIVNLGMGRDVNGEDLGLDRDQINKKLRALIRRRNRRNQVWGWKDPAAYQYLEAISDELINPIVILVTRDTTSIALSEMARSGCTIEQGFDTALKRLIEYWSLLNTKAWPTLLVSYERALASPRVLANDIAGFVGIEPPGEDVLRRVERYCIAGDYRILPLSGP